MLGAAETADCWFDEPDPADRRSGAMPSGHGTYRGLDLELDAVRRRAREPVSGMADRRAAAPAGEPDGIRLDVVNALLQLGEIDRQIVVLHDMAGLTHAEVAAELRLPAGTVRWRYRVALARLRPLVEEEVS